MTYDGRMDPSMVDRIPAAALDGIDRFIAVAEDIATMSLFGKRKSEPVARAIYNIARKLLETNENMSRWLNRFLYFDFGTPDARSRFLELVQHYRTARAGPEFQEMKYSCSDIYLIYRRHIAGQIPNLVPEDKVEETKFAFLSLGVSDQDMVEVIANSLIGGIDGFVQGSESDVDRSDLNSAERRRLEFKAASAGFTARIEGFATQLSGIVLTYARLANISLTPT
jgi:hypothetical protein